MRRPPNETPPLVQKGGASKRDLVGAEIKSEDNPFRRGPQARRRWVHPHAIDRYIERSGKQGFSHIGIVREILSPRVVAAMDRAPQGRSVYRDPWGPLSYVIVKSDDDAFIMTVILRRWWQERGAA